ncbi:MAG TPA: Flp1 family type IVb pilin [Thermoclostridium sp.]
MKKMIKKFISDQKGINTVEVVVLVAIALGLALIFREQILNFINKILGEVLDADAFTLPK